MTIQDLNRDIKRLKRDVQKQALHNDSATGERYEKEFKRLYGADTEMKSINRESILTLLRLNLRYRWVPFHSFGIMIEL